MVWRKIRKCSFSREDDESQGVGFEASKDQPHFQCQLNFQTKFVILSINVVDRWMMRQIDRQIDNSLLSVLWCAV